MLWGQHLGLRTDARAFLSGAEQGMGEWIPIIVPI